MEYHAWLEKLMNEAAKHKTDDMALVHRLWVLADELDAVALMLTTIDSADGGWEFSRRFGEMKEFVRAAQLAREIALTNYPET